MHTYELSHFTFCSQNIMHSKLFLRTFVSLDCIFLTVLGVQWLPETRVVHVMEHGLEVSFLFRYLAC